MSQPVEGIDLNSWVRQSKVFQFQGHALRYWDEGQGEPLLLIHGFPSGSWDWQYLWQPLAQRYRVIACDMLGFGFSAKPRGHRYSLIEQADIQQALMTLLGVRRYHVLAHDYGDSVAQELLARDRAGPSFLTSLCFLNGGLFPETHRPVLVQKLLMSPFGFLIGKGFNQDKLKQNFGRVFGPDTQPSERELAGFWEMIACNNEQAVMHRLIQYMPERKVHRDRWVEAMQNTQVPMRVIDGAADPVSGAHMVARYRELITRADTVLLDGIGHYPQVEAPEQVLAAYLDFRSEKAEAA